MKNTDLTQELLARLSETKNLCKDMRFGQMLATLGELAHDSTGRSLWDIEDEEFAGVIERFGQDLARRKAGAA